jgi:hypothetical protein
MTDREHCFFILGYAKGNKKIIKTYLAIWNIDTSVLDECNEEIKRCKELVNS